MIPVSEVMWEYFGDPVMGGVSEGSARMEDGAVRLMGRVSTANNGGFIQARADLDAGPPEGATGMTIRVRGNGERYFIHLRRRGVSMPWQFYQAAFETGQDWQEITLLWSNFAPFGNIQPAAVPVDRIRSLALVAYGRDHDADVWLQSFGWAGA